MTEKKDCLALEKEESTLGHLHGHIHQHREGHFEPHIHEHICHGHYPGFQSQEPIITIRSHSGLSGDMLLTGLAVLYLENGGIDPLSEDGKNWLSQTLNNILPELGSSVSIHRHAVNGIGGWQATVELPQTHEHRTLKHIQKIIADSSITPNAKDFAEKCFQLLAECEGEVHGKSPEDIHFHEVGALDSILDICAVCEIYCLLDTGQIICGPLPMADGHVSCAHGIIPAPAPAVLRLLKNVPVSPFAGAVNAGELVTPTALALLHTLKARFGHWPAFHIQATALVYGQREFSNAPNGVVFAIGR